MSHNIKPGVATGDEVQAIFAHAKENNYALPAVNVTSSSTVNGVLEAAAKLNSPVIIQFSNALLLPLTSVVLLRARFWHQVIQRFIQVDEYVLLETSSADPI